MNFIRGQAIYKRAKSETNGIYFVAAGEFEVTTQVEEEKGEKIVRKLPLSARDGNGGVADTIRLMLLGRGDYFGLDEVFKGLPIR